MGQISPKPEPDATSAITRSMVETRPSVHGPYLDGFDSFSVSERAATIGRNPRTGEQIQIAASKQSSPLP